MTDPRERVETENLLCEIDEDDGGNHVWQVHSSAENYAAGWADWLEIVELAHKILAADEAWKDGQTPTLEGLRAKYPGIQFGHAGEACGPTFCDIAWVGNPTSQGKHFSGNHFESETAALRWLAAKLEELTDE